MIAIQTKYLAATDSKPSRIKAWTSSGFSATISYPHEFSHELCHFEAVKALVFKHSLPWDLADMRYGGTEKGYVFCFANAIVVESSKWTTTIVPVVRDYREPSCDSCLGQ